MYAATLFLFLSMPLVLGSPISFVIMLAYLPIIGRRMKNEEEVLVNGLDGYAEYRERVRYKVIPYIWQTPETEAKPLPRTGGAVFVRFE